MTDGYERIYRQTLLSNDSDQAAMESARSAPGGSPAARDHDPQAAAERISQAV